MQFSLVLRLSKEEKEVVKQIVEHGKYSRTVKRAEILLYSDKGYGRDSIASLLDVNLSTVQRIRDKYLKGGLQLALSEKKRPGAPKKLSKQGEEHLRMLVKNNPPSPHLSWTIELLKERMVIDRQAPEDISLSCLWKQLKTLGWHPSSF